MQQQQQEQEEQHHFHVLAVDDSVIDRKLLEKLLKVSSYHYQVTCVDSGYKALEYLGLLNNLGPDLSSPSFSSTSSSCFQSSQQEIVPLYQKIFSLCCKILYSIAYHFFLLKSKAFDSH
ncbi:hypothetical protein CRYUN_Cryun28dG0039600 [Craigia yunnanensis]